MVDAFNAEDDDRLRDLLGLRPWEASPLDYEIGEECKHPPQSAEALSWPKAQLLREELEAFAAPRAARRKG
jgi:hypothetical protein